MHAKVCVIDDVWGSVGSDNFNERSWTHDSELTAAIVEPGGGEDNRFARDLRLRLAAEHLGRLGEGEPDVSDCVDGASMFRTYRDSARALDAWHAGGRVGPRPPGHLRLLDVPDLAWWHRAWARVPLETVHDPDGRPRALKKSDDY